MRHLIIVLVAILAVTVNCKRMRKTCPDLMPYANFTIDKILGTSYLKFAYYSTGLKLNTTKCYRDTLTLKNDSINLNIKYENENGTLYYFDDHVKFNSTTPGVFTKQEEITVYNFFGYPEAKNATRYFTVLYADQYLFALYACLEIDNYWWTEADYYYTVSVRNRGFDSINKLKPVIQALENIPENLNNMEFINNDQTCTN